MKTFEAAKLDSGKLNMRFQQKSADYISAIYSSQINVLLVMVFFWDLLSPYLIWKGVLPGFTRWISDAVMVIIIVLVYTRMMTMDKIPAAMLAIVFFLVIGVTVAFLNGQGALATIWGAWLMFKYPLAGIYVYLQFSWYQQIFVRLRKICVAILTFEVFFQIFQYLMGEPIGDNLAGTFGSHGTGPLLEFTMFVLCLALAQWIAERRWSNLGWVMMLGLVSSVLGEIKFFLPASFILLTLGFAVFIIKNGQLWKLMSLAVPLGFIILAFVIGYNTFVPGAKARPIESYILDQNTLDGYLNAQEESNIPGVYYMGRSAALQYGWDTISRDPITLLFGMGLGARSESRSLGIAGNAISGSAGNYRAQGGLLTLIQETGLLGLCVLGLFILWVTATLFWIIKFDSQSSLREVRYAMILFSLLWPLWLYYTTVWDQEALMVLYWASLGYVLAESYEAGMRVKKSTSWNDYDGRAG